MKIYLLVMVLSGITIALPAQDFYVSPQGNDKHPGTIQQPFATIEKARTAVQKRTPCNKPITIFLKGGIYYQGQPLKLNAEDGGSIEAAVTYAAFQHEQVYLRGSKPIPAKSFKRIKDSETLSRIPAHLKDSIFSVDLTALQINHIKAYANKFDDDGDLLELFMNEKRMPLSRYPNKGDMTIKKVIINGGGQETKTGNWADYYGEKPPATLPPRKGVFEYRDTRTNNWINALDRGVWLKGFWRIPWQNEAVRVEKIDTIARTITLAVPVPGGIGNKYTRPEGNSKEPYWLLNLLEEIDMPGEWAVDFKDKKLYFYPPEKITNDNCRIADIGEPLLQLNSTSNVAFKNITIEENLHDGIIINGGKNNLIAGCTVRNVTKNAITVDGGEDHTILSNDLYDLGSGGVWLRGGDENAIPRIACNFKVVNNHIYRYSQITRIYAAAINAGFSGGGGGGHHPCVGAYIAHNMVHDAPHVGILFGSWDNTFEYNEIFNYCLVSDDMGAFYSYDLYERMGGHTFAYNFIHNSSIGDGIYFDHDHRDIKIYGNLVALNSAPKRRGTGFLYKIGSQVKNPQTITCYNNMAINCNYGFEVVTTGSPATNLFDNNIAVSCTVPFEYKFVTDRARDIASTAITNGTNLTYTSDPGFVNMKAYNFHLKSDSKIFKDLPNFKPLPIDKMGLFIDEYRKKLPKDEEVNRFINMKNKDGFGTDILDRQ